MNTLIFKLKRMVAGLKEINYEPCKYFWKSAFSQAKIYIPVSIYVHVISLRICLYHSQIL